MVNCALLLRLLGRRFNSCSMSFKFDSYIFNFVITKTSPVKVFWTPLDFFGISIGNIPWNSKDSNWKLGILGILGMGLEWNWKKNPKIHDFLVIGGIKFFQ
jgi:hypothetical protein